MANFSSKCRIQIVVGAMRNEAYRRMIV